MLRADGRTEEKTGDKVSPMMRRNFIQVIEADIAGESIPALQWMWNQGGGIHIHDFFISNSSISNQY